MKILGRMAVFPDIPERITVCTSWPITSGGPGPPTRIASTPPSARNSGRPANTTPSACCWRSTRRGWRRSPTIATSSRATTPFCRASTPICIRQHLVQPDLPRGHATRPSPTSRAEFGLHESLPIYSGGLGILAGDHCKEASDLGLPFVGVGFLYPQGYFRQRISREGEQEAIYEKLHFSQVPAMPALDPDGHEVIDQRRSAGAHGLRQGLAHPGRARFRST